MSRLRTRLAAAGLGTVAAAVCTLAAALPAQADTLTASASSSTCSTAPWEGVVQGEPAGYKAGSATAATIWHDSSGFHLRVTHPGTSRKVFTGVITADEPMHVAGYHLEKGDIVTLSKNHRTLAFSFVDYGALDGANITTNCATKLTVSRLHVGDAALPAGEVDLGSGKAHPAAVPFAITRAASTTAH